MTGQYRNKKPFSHVSWFFIGLIVAGFSLILAFRLFGISVGPDGMLEESFYLLGAGWILSIVGFAGLLIRIATSLMR